MLQILAILTLPLFPQSYKPDGSLKNREHSSKITLESSCMLMTKCCQYQPAIVCVSEGRRNVDSKKVKRGPTSALKKHFLCNLAASLLVWSLRACFFAWAQMSSRMQGTRGRIKCIATQNSETKTREHFENFEGP